MSFVILYHCITETKRNKFRLDNLARVEALQLHFNTQSHLSSGSTVYLLPRGAGVHFPGMHNTYNGIGFSC